MGDVLQHVQQLRNEITSLEKEVERLAPYELRSEVYKKKYEEYHGKYKYLKTIVHSLQRKSFKKAVSVLNRIREETNVHNLMTKHKTIYIRRGIEKEGT